MAIDDNATAWAQEGKPVYYRGKWGDSSQFERIEGCRLAGGRDSLWEIKRGQPESTEDTSNVSTIKPQLDKNLVLATVNGITKGSEYTQDVNMLARGFKQILEDCDNMDDVMLAVNGTEVVYKELYDFAMNIVDNMSGEVAADDGGVWLRLSTPNTTLAGL